MFVTDTRRELRTVDNKQTNKQTHKHTNTQTKKPAFPHCRPVILSSGWAKILSLIYCHCHPHLL